jgi:hypothetical protein
LIQQIINQPINQSIKFLSEQKETFFSAFSLGAEERLEGFEPLNSVTVVECPTILLPPLTYKLKI